MVYPNPSKGELSLALQNNSEIKHIELISSNGQKDVFPVKDNWIDDKVLSLDISSLQNCCYILRVHTEHLFYQKIIIILK